MSSIPPVLPAGQPRKRDTARITVVAVILALFLGTVFLWPAVSSIGSGPARVAMVQSTDLQSDERLSTAPAVQEITSPAVNPELWIQERFRAAQAAATAGRMLYDNPELKTLEYAMADVAVDLYANPELKTRKYYPSQSNP